MTLPDVLLRDVTKEDLPVFFQHQQDPEAIRMAAFTVRDPGDLQAFTEKWGRILRDGAIVKRTVEVEGQVAGHVVRFEHLGQPEITYWLGRTFWGRGIATAALTAFLGDLERPLTARVAKDNVGSRRVLEKCGFVVTGEDRGFAHGRGQPTEEFILELA